MRVNKITFLTLVLAALAPAVCAYAQDDGALLREGLFARDRNVSVTERPRPEYDPLTVHLGAFSVLPSLSASVEGNDNIYAVTSDRASDTIFRINPAVTARSNWNRNALTLFGNLNSDYYASHHGEQTTDYLVGGDGRLDVSHDLGFAGGASYERDTEPRTSSASPALASKPVQYDVARGYAEGTWASPRLRVSGRFSVDDYTYDNAHTTAGVLVYERDRDHTQYTESAKVEYALVPDTSVFLQVAGNEREYRDQLPTEISRSSSGYLVHVGANFDLTHLIRGEIGLGYQDQTYDAGIYSEIKGFSFNGQVQWFATQLTTVTFSGSRTPEDAGIPNVGGYTSTNLSASVDHELLRNVLLNAGLTYGHDEYQNYDRTDDRTGETVGVKYLMNRALTLNLAYSHYNQDSSGAHAGFNFDVNRIYATVTYAY